jgi:hypothetical protein
MQSDGQRRHHETHGEGRPLLSVGQLMAWAELMLDSDADFGGLPPSVRIGFFLAQPSLLGLLDRMSFLEEATRPPCVRLYPDNPGNPRTLIESESPLQGRTYGLVVQAINVVLIYLCLRFGVVPPTSTHQISSDHTH